MSDTLMRHWEMLKAIPREPAKIDTRSLMTLLNQKGFSVSQRTVQRDLGRLAGIFPDLMTDKNPDVAGWSWRKNSTINDFPSIDPPMALTFKLVENFLQNLIPPSVLGLIQPYLSTSDTVLAELDDRNYRDWSSKVAIVPRTQPLIPATVDPEVVRVVYESLLHQKRFRGWYNARSGTRPHPSARSSSPSTTTRSTSSPSRPRPRGARCG